MDCRWQVEINPFRRKVLATHWPEVSRYEDIKECGVHNLEPVDCITAGVPCQDWSVAGRRAGITGKRSGLFFEFARILQELRPTWFVFENVPGLFSQNEGRDFATVLSVLMEECGFGISWRVLDSQYFGLAQRRKRVYIVGHFGAVCPAEILFEPKGRSGNSEEGEETGKDVAAAVTGGIGRVGSRGADDGENIVVADTLTRNYYKGGANGGKDGRHKNIVAHPIRAQSNIKADGGDNLVAATLGAHNTGGWQSEPGEHLVASTLTSRSSPKGHGAAGPRVEDIPNFVIQDVRGGTRDKTDHGQGIGIREGGPCYTLSKTERHGVAYALRAGRRIADSNGNEGNVVLSAKTYPNGSGDIAGLPEGVDDPSNPDGQGCQGCGGYHEPGECWPLLPKGLDSPRYQALGDAVSVPVAEWIGKRIIQFTKE